VPGFPARRCGVSGDTGPWPPESCVTPSQEIDGESSCFGITRARRRPSAAKRPRLLTTSVLRLKPAFEVPCVRREVGSPARMPVLAVSSGSRGRVGGWLSRLMGIYRSVLGFCGRGVRLLLVRSESRPGSAGAAVRSVRPVPRSPVRTPVLPYSRTGRLPAATSRTTWLPAVVPLHVTHQMVAVMSGSLRFTTTSSCVTWSP
jgi:hypothetical protein